MPVPKRKTSKSRRDKRSSGKFIRPQAITYCANCQDPLSTHQACPACGYYKGRKVMNTKLERTLKRSESRRPEQQPHAHQAAEGHEYPNEK
jgi:large subunit ribosomal protein L32